MTFVFVPSKWLVVLLCVGLRERQHIKTNVRANISNDNDGRSCSLIRLFFFVDVFFASPLKDANKLFELCKNFHNIQNGKENEFETKEKTGKNNDRKRGKIYGTRTHRKKLEIFMFLLCCFFMSAVIKIRSSNLSRHCCGATR